MTMSLVSSGCSNADSDPWADTKAACERFHDMKLQTAAAAAVPADAVQVRTVGGGGTTSSLCTHGVPGEQAYIALVVAKDGEQVAQEYLHKPPRFKIDEGASRSIDGIGDEAIRTVLEGEDARTRASLNFRKGPYLVLCNVWTDAISAGEAEDLMRAFAAKL